ncbi:MAG: urea ABC transporter permease subunit UrtC [Leptolyngbya sp.]|nr:urea ABC transporter permease subunit UrtC [Leptolyngbya sp.]
MVSDATTQPRLAVKASQKRKLLIEAAVIVAIALILIVVMPLLLSGFRLNLLGRFLALAIVALGIDLIWGFTGLLSLGHGIFFALGGYAFAMYLELNTLPEGRIPEFFGLYGVTDLPWFWQPFNSFPFTLIAIFTIPAIVAGLLGYLVFRNRIRGVYFSILTQAALVVFFNLFNGQQKLINGTNGLKTSTSIFWGQQVGSPGMRMFFYITTVVVLVAVYVLCRWLTSGRFGRMLVAIRDDENRVRFSGYDPTAFKVLVFAVSGAIAGIAGALFTVQSGIISPQSMDIAFSIEMVIWVAVGGRATLVGAVLGAVLVNMARSLLSEKFPDIWLFFQGALFLIVVTTLPNGIIGWGRNQFGSIISNSLGLASTDIPYADGTEPDPEPTTEAPEYVEQ